MTEAASDRGAWLRLAERVLAEHQRQDNGLCTCAWQVVGQSHPAHVARMLDGVGALKRTP